MSYKTVSLFYDRLRLTGGLPACTTLQASATLYTDDIPELERKRIKAGIEQGWLLGQSLAFHIINARLISVGTNLSIVGPYQCSLHVPADSIQALFEYIKALDVMTPGVVSMVRQFHGTLIHVQFHHCIIDLEKFDHRKKVNAFRAAIQTEVTKATRPLLYMREQARIFLEPNRQIVIDLTKARGTYQYD